MERIAVVPTPAMDIVSKSHGLDFDHDGRREFILRAYEQGTSFGGRHEFYESIANDTFVLAHTLELSDATFDSFHPADAGDIDQDGRADLVVLVQDFGPGGTTKFGLRVFEGTETQPYPNLLTWEAIKQVSGWWFGGWVVDGDIDGKLEVVAVRPKPQYEFVAYENVADNAYDETVALDIPSGTGQSFGVLDDIDDDGRPEILWGAFDRICAFESTSDNAYAMIWTWDFAPDLNVDFIVDAGDLDGDGKKEFLAGGLGAASVTRLNVFEPVGDNAVEIVATLTQSTASEGYPSATVADVDGDGRKEIVLATASPVGIYENVGDNSWEKVWTGQGNLMTSVGAGDHDKDGKDEIIFREGSAQNGFTGVWEINAAYASDPDHDGTVTAIDNCPLLYNPGQEDSDADAVGNACDNCLYGPNADQGAAPLGQTILATDAETFAWPVAADVVYLRGDLAGVNLYGFDLVDSLPLATSITDSSVPSSGSGFYYLVRPDCPVGSWQSTIGAEPGRDEELP